MESIINLNVNNVGEKEVKEKQCPKCKVTRSQTNFYIYKNNLSSYCKPCTKKYKRSNYRKRAHAAKVEYYKTPKVNPNIIVSPWELFMDNSPHGFAEMFKKTFKTNVVPRTQAQFEELFCAPLVDIYLRRAILIYGYKMAIIDYFGKDLFSTSPTGSYMAKRQARLANLVHSVIQRKEFFNDNDKFRGTIPNDYSFICDVHIPK